MIETLLNPEWLESDCHMNLLNQAFPGAWDRPAFDWYLRRTFRDGRPDILVRASGRSLLSGLTLVPRQVQIGCDPPIDVAVLSAGGTLPSERRCGHYAELLRAAVERARERAWTALLGFVTEGNGSGRGVRRMGARTIPSFYLTTQVRGWRTGKVSPEKRASECIRPSPAARQNLDARSENHARFHYAQVEDWRRQFLERPHGVRVVQLDDNSRAWIETVGSTDRMQRLDCPAWKTRQHVTTLARASEAAGRRFFFYSLDAQLAAAVRRRGFAINRGLFLLLPVDSSSVAWQRLSGASWRVQSGDRL